MNKTSFLFATLIALFFSCNKKVDPPVPYGSVPTENQLRWHEMEYYALGESPNESSFKKYTNQINIPKGGLVHAYTLDEASGHHSDIITKEFGIAKADWEIRAFDSEKNNQAIVYNAIDGDSNTYWVSSATGKNKHQYIVIDLKDEIDIFTDK